MHDGWNLLLDMCRYGYPLRSCLWVRLGLVYVVLGLGQPVVVWACTFPIYRFLSCTTRHQRTSLLSPYTASTMYDQKVVVCILDKYMHAVFLVPSVP